MGLKIGVLGSGSWATAMLKMLGDNEVPKEVYWWVRKKDDIDYILKHHHNPSYLSSVHIPIETSHISADQAKIVGAADIVILNTPATYLKDCLRHIDAKALKGKTIVSSIKGIIPDENEVVGDFIQRAYGVPLENIVVVGGPCHAEEVSQEKLSYLTVASKHQGRAKEIASLLNTHYIKTNISTDVFGLEYAAVLKNIYALAGGIAKGLGYGDNFQAVLISNAIREMAHFVSVLDKNERNIDCSAYLGDLLVTAYSQFSRNRTFGNMIGKGYSVQSAQLEMNMVAEGYYASDCIQSIIHRHNLRMPICDSVYSILHQKQKANAIMNKLVDKLT